MNNRFAALTRAHVAWSSYAETLLLLCSPPLAAFTATTTAIQAMQGQGLGEGGYYAVGMSQSCGVLVRRPGRARRLALRPGHGARGMSRVFA